MQFCGRAGQQGFQAVIKRSAMQQATELSLIEAIYHMS